MASVIEFIPIPRLVRCRLTAHAIGYNATLMHLLNFEAPGTPTAADCESVNNVVGQWVLDSYKAQVSNQVNFATVESWSGEDQFGPAATNVIDQDGSAISSEMYVDYAWAPRIGLKTANRGRAATGAIYMFPPVQEAVNPNSYSPVHLSGLVASCQWLLDHALSAAMPWVVASESRLTLYPILSFKPTARLTMQTRRRPDFGR
jgi:hypothetical protein